MLEQTEVQAPTRPLCVDLDGTLVNTDTLVELALALARKNPLYILAMAIWLISGRANLKEQINRRVSLSIPLLPFNQPFVDWLRGQRDVGRKLILVTASNHQTAEAIADHLQLFSSVIASSATENIKSGAKRDALVDAYGSGGFDYAGNSRDDLPVWADCSSAILVNTPADVANRARQCARVECEFAARGDMWRGLAKAMRPYQWSKNLLVFVSIIIAQQFTDPELLLSTIIAFIAFCLCSSSVYLVNDMLDLEVDRKHSEKKRRPFASGWVPLYIGLAAAPVLLLASALFALLAGPMFCKILLIYFVTTLAYSFYLKRIMLLDVLLLAILYTIRIMAGAAVAGQMPSVWLVSFSMFLFTSLAIAKRYSELRNLEQRSGSWVGGRGYHVDDLGIITQLGAASGYISTLVLALYIDSPEVVALYPNQQVMWLLVPLLMYWVGRIWLVAGRGLLQQDPVVYATRDPVSYLVFLLGVFILAVAL